MGYFKVYSRIWVENLCYNLNRDSIQRHLGNKILRSLCAESVRKKCYWNIISCDRRTGSDFAGGPLPSGKQGRLLMHCCSPGSLCISWKAHIPLRHVYDGNCWCKQLGRVLCWNMNDTLVEDEICHMATMWVVINVAISRVRHWARMQTRVTETTLWLVFSIENKYLYTWAM